MDLKTEEERVAEEYSSTLSELNSISKVEINALTMLAEDNKEFAVQIAACIENHLKSVPSKNKLPILYLIDSICKNYPKSIYVQLFTQNIVSNFCNVFEVSGEKVRKSLHKLRMTWDATKTFPQKKLNAIDKRVHEMDPNWPVLHKITAGASSQRTNTNNNNNNNNKNNGSNNRNRNNDNLTPTNHQQQNLTITAATNGLPHQPPPPPPLPLSSQPHPIQPTLGPQNLVQPGQQMQQILIFQPHVQQQHFDYQTTDGMYQQALPTIQAQPNFQTQAMYATQQQHIQPYHHPSLPSGLDSTLDSLYGGKQCSNCSLRFDDNNKYAFHLDWHFRQNLKSDKMFARRKWYYPLNLWVQFREINDDDIQENSNSDNNVNDLLISHNDNEVPTAPASKEDEKNICSVCHEAFEKFWAEEEEEWRLKNARQHDDERVYHPLCLIDMLQTSSVVQ